MLWPGMANPSIAMKCMTQIPQAPIETAAKISQRALAGPSWARALVTQRSPRNAPRQDMTYASAGLNTPLAKLCTVTTNSPLELQPAAVGVSRGGRHVRL